jgi:6-pyruvoyltetrahydropterin/6-carboxytetrahydropterin synthase
MYSHQLSIKEDRSFVSSGQRVWTQSPFITMKCIINRRAQFSASHRYWLPELGEAENIQRFGACSRFPGHGHNYVLFVYMAGELDEYGMVLNLSDVKHVIKREVTSQLDFSYLNDVWPEFKQTLPTTENLAQVIWQRLSPHLPIVRIQLFEHPELWADYLGDGMEAYLTLSTHFSAAHRLARPDLSYEENCEIYGKCARPNGHGHNYHLEVTVKGEMDDRTGMIVDLGDLQKVIDDYVVEPFDHTFLNKDIPYFANVVPTAENIAVHIGNLLKQPIWELGAQLYKVKLIESPNNFCEVYAADLLPKEAKLKQNEPVLVRL